MRHNGNLSTKVQGLQSFARATAKDTATRIAPAIITMANTPA
jgi:hypothetical protein